MRCSIGPGKASEILLISLHITCLFRDTDHFVIFLFDLNIFLQLIKFWNSLILFKKFPVLQFFSKKKKKITGRLSTLPTPKTYFIFPWASARPHRWQHGSFFYGLHTWIVPQSHWQTFLLLPHDTHPVIHSKLRAYLEMALSDSSKQGWWERNKPDIYWNFKFSHVLGPDHKYLYAVILGWGLDAGKFKQSVLKPWRTPMFRTADLKDKAFCNF